MENRPIMPNERVFLITGKPRIGKSTTIKKLLTLLGSHICGGFYTEEIRDSNDRIGFRCIAVEKPIPYESWDLNAPNFNLLARIDGK